ncbi:Plasmodium exported protein, unknown function [Plasmodium ovale]|uniref:Uncharacterized protein n=1 Tax=Plasmodium ovale TaxID=36330 RepID=A0A1C3KR90_PLAOA|nr:Plasmodium exported protein, unknown function [Plasmodium ovale]
MKNSNSINEFVAILEIPITMNKYTDVLNPILEKKLTKKEVDDQLPKCGQNKTKKQIKYKFKSYLKDYECLWNDSVERATDLWTNLMNKIENYKK